MQTKRGVAAVLVIVLVVSALVLAGTVLYKQSGGNFNSPSQDLQKISTDDPDLSKSDEISDIENDLNSTQIENMDANVVGISSEVE